MLWKIDHTKEDLVEKVLKMLSDGELTYRNLNLMLKRISLIGWMDAQKDETFHNWTELMNRRENIEKEHIMSNCTVEKAIKDLADWHYEYGRTDQLSGKVFEGIG